jgi:IS30 family transposase
MKATPPPVELALLEEVGMERLSAREKERIAELLAEGAPVWRLHEEIHRSRWAIHRAVNALLRQPKQEPTRSSLRLSLTEREEISRGLAAGESLRVIAGRLGRAPRRSRVR